MDAKVRKMIKDDINNFYLEFKSQGWNKPKELFEMYYNEQCNKQRIVFVAEFENQVLGYATLLESDLYGPFANKNIPTVCDFNVLEKYQKNGIGKVIFDEIESYVKTYSNKICLGVGMHKGYGAAQRMYVKRGYIPDGSGIWYNNEVLEQNKECKNNDELVLYLYKNL